MKKIIALLLVLAMAFGLVACGGSEAPAATEAPKADAPAAAPEAPAAAEKAEDTVIAAEYGTKTKAWWADFVEKFNAANENINLIVEVVSWNDINAVVDTRVANGQAPDLLNIDAHVKYLEDDLLLPTDEWVSEETFAKFYPGFVAASKDADGTVWAIPDLASARFLYVNTDILAQAGIEKAPATWSEVRAACEAIKANVADVYPWGVDMTTDEGQAAFSYYTWNNGGGFINENMEWAVNSAENVEAMEFIIGLYNDGLTNSDPGNETRYALQDLFAAGKLAMVIAPTQIEGVCAEAGNGVNFAKSALPCNDGKSSVAMGVMDRIMCFDNGYSDEELAAITKVIDAFYDDEPYAEWVLMEGFIPATAPGGELCIAADPSMEELVGMISTAQFYPAIDGWDEAKFGVIDAQQEMLMGEDIQTVLDNLQAELVG